MKKSSAKKAQALPGAAAKKIARPKTASGKTEKISADKAAIPTIKSPQSTKEKKQTKPAKKKISAKTKALKTTGMKKVEDRLSEKKMAVSGQLSAVSPTKRVTGRVPEEKAAISGRRSAKSRPKKDEGRMPERKEAISGRQSVISKTTKSKGRVSRGKTAISHQLSAIGETNKGQDRMPERKGRVKDKRGYKDTDMTELPEEYGENEVILMPVDPNMVFVDWEIRKEEFPEAKKGLTMRVFDVGGSKPPTRRGESSADFQIQGRVGCGFFDINMPGREVSIEIGFYDHDNFLPILRSPIVSMPRLTEFDDLGIAEDLFEPSSPMGY